MAADVATGRRGVRNAVLRRLGDDAYGSLRPHLEPVDLVARDVLHQAGEVPSHIYFPEGGVISFAYDLPSGRTVDFGLIGNEGLSSFSILRPKHASPVRTVVLVGGHPAFRIAREPLQRAFREHEDLRAGGLRRAVPVHGTTRLHIDVQRCPYGDGAHGSMASPLRRPARRLADPGDARVLRPSADKDDLARLEARLRGDASVTMLVNNAGIGSVASILKADVETVDAMIQLNITALARLTYAVAPAFVERGSGTIVNISSVVGIAAEVLNGVYSASKSFVLSFGHSLQKDLADKGVRVQTVLPGATATEFWDVAGYAAQKTSAITMSADDLVDAALAGLDRSELVTIPGLQDEGDWTRWEADRRTLSAKFNNAKPAPRYALESAEAS